MAISITTATPLVNAVNGAYYSQTLAASGGVGPYFFYTADGAGNLPPGLTITPSGVILPIGSAVGGIGNYTFRLLAIDSSGSAQRITKDFTISVVETTTTAAIATPFNVNNLLPERFFKDAPDWDEVTTKHEYQDGGVSFNAANSVAPMEHEWIFSGLTKTEAAAFDAHYDQARGQLFDFPYLERDGVTFYPKGWRYKTFKRSHDGNRSWVQARRIVLIKYP